MDQKKSPPHCDYDYDDDDSNDSNHFSISENKNSTILRKENILLQRFKSAALKIKSHSSLKPLAKATYNKELSKANKYFNVPLLDIRKDNGHLVKEDGIPLFIERCFDILQCNSTFFNCEGLFRMSGSIIALNKLKDSIGNDDLLSIDLVDDPHLLSGIIKLFLRELNPPLLTFELFEPISLICMNHHPERLDLLQSLLRMLPFQNYNLLSYILEKIITFGENFASTKMGLNNLALVFGPNLGWINDSSSDDIINSTSMSTSITLELLKNYKSLFLRDKRIGKVFSLGILEDDGRYIIINKLINSTYYEGTVFGNGLIIREKCVDKECVLIVISSFVNDDIFSDENI